MVDSELRWHPKITPYRLTVLATTVSLGTAKAVLTQMGSVVIPTTFEWISGTVVFLMLFIVSPYDSEEVAPSYLSWLFELDCMDLIWHLLRVTFTIPRPNYRSEERQFTFSTTNPPITSYRVLVSSSVVAFGVTKATFVYLGASTAATWTDWVSGVVATSIFYCLGLYENNSLNLWPAFFATDQRHHLRQATTATAYAAGIALSVTWILYWKEVLRRHWHDTFNSTNPDVHLPFLKKVLDIAIKSLLPELIIFFIALGMACLALDLYFFSISGSLRVLAPPFRAVRARIFGGVLPLVSGDSDGSIHFLAGISKHYIERTTTFFRVCIHIALHLFSLAVCLAMSVIVSGVVAVLFDAIKIPNHIFLTILFFTIAGGFITTIAGILWIFNFVIVVSMVTPVFNYHSSGRFRSSLISP